MRFLKSLFDDDMEDVGFTINGIAINEGELWCEFCQFVNTSGVYNEEKATLQFVCGGCKELNTVRGVHV